MRAVLRLGMTISAAGLALAPLPALAQDATTPSETPATDAVGPRDLQNFTLNGTVTRSADPVAVQRPTARPPAQSTRTETPAPASAAPAESSSPPATERAAARPPAPTSASQRNPDTAPAPAFTPAARPSPSVTTQLPPIDDAPVATASGTLTPPTDSLGNEHRLLLWPWLLAALALGAGGAFLFWRNRSRAAFAGGPQFDAFVAPEASPAPRPAPAPAPPKAPLPAPTGLVSTRLRPWVDFAFQPGRCIVEDDKVTFEFELALQNTGNAPARAVLVEATLLNAGPYQDQEVSAFYGSPVGEGERIPVIPPFKTMVVQTKVVALRENVQLLDIGGRQVFVPLIAFNALYNWSNGEGQTSASYMLGRETKGEKLAPFRLDLGPRVIRHVGIRLLPIAVRK